MNKRREFPAGIYSTQDARARLGDILELVREGQPVVLMHYKRVVAVLGAVPLPDEAREALRSIGIDPEVAEAEYKPRYSRQTTTESRRVSRARPSEIKVGGKPGRVSGARVGAERGDSKTRVRKASVESVPEEEVGEATASSQDSPIAQGEVGTKKKRGAIAETLEDLGIMLGHGEGVTGREDGALNSAKSLERAFVTSNPKPQSKARTKR